MGRAKYDIKRLPVKTEKYIDKETGRQITKHVTAYMIVPILKRKYTNRTEVLRVEPHRGVPPENLHEQLSSISGHSLEFSPNPFGQGKELKGLKPGKLAQYLVLRYLFEDDVWVDLNLWDLGTKLLEDWIKYFPTSPFLLTENTKSKRREIFSYALKFLLTEVKPGEKPLPRIRYALSETLKEEGLSSSFLWRSWQGQMLVYGFLLSKLLTKLKGPGKPPKKTRRRRSSEDSRGAPHGSSRRSGFRAVSLPPLEIVVDSSKKWYVWFCNKLAYHYAFSRNIEIVLRTTSPISEKSQP